MMSDAPEAATCTTEEDLAALPYSSVVLDPGGFAWQSDITSEGMIWQMAGSAFSVTSAGLLPYGPTAPLRNRGPLIVLFVAPR